MTCRLLSSFLLPSWRVVRCYRSHLEDRETIWGDDWLHSPFIRLSPSWGFPGFSSAIRQMPRDLCAALDFISLSPLSLAGLGKWSVAMNPNRNYWHCFSSIELFWLKPLASWAAGVQKVNTIWRKMFKRRRECDTYLIHVFRRLFNIFYCFTFPGFPFILIMPYEEVILTWNKC